MQTTSSTQPHSQGHQVSPELDTVLSPQLRRIGHAAVVGLLYIYHEARPKVVPVRFQQLIGELPGPTGLPLKLFQNLMGATESDKGGTIGGTLGEKARDLAKSILNRALWPTGGHCVLPESSKAASKRFVGWLEKKGFLPDQSNLVDNVIWVKDPFNWSEWSGASFPEGTELYPYQPNDTIVNLLRNGEIPSHKPSKKHRKAMTLMDNKISFKKEFERCSEGMSSQELKDDGVAYPRFDSRRNWFLGKRWHGMTAEEFNSELDKLVAYSKASYYYGDPDSSKSGLVIQIARGAGGIGTLVLSDQKLDTFKTQVSSALEQGLNLDRAIRSSLESIAAGQGFASQEIEIAPRLYRICSPSIEIWPKLDENGQLEDLVILGPRFQSLCDKSEFQGTAVFPDIAANPEFQRAYQEMLARLIPVLKSRGVTEPIAIDFLVFYDDQGNLQCAPVDPNLRLNGAWFAEQIVFSIPPWHIALEFGELAFIADAHLYTKITGIGDEHSLESFLTELGIPIADPKSLEPRGVVITQPVDKNEKEKETIISLLYVGRDSKDVGALREEVIAAIRPDPDRLGKIDIVNNIALFQRQAQKATSV